MNILVDGRPFVKTSAGISTFLRCSLIEWGRLNLDSNIYVFLPKRLDETLDLSQLPSNVKMLRCDCWLTNRIPNLLLLLLYVPIICRLLKIDVYYAPVPCLPFGLPAKIKKLIVVHDVVNLDQADTMELKNKISNRLFFFRSIKNADYIWTNSAYTKERVCHYVPNRKCQEFFTGCSVDRYIYKKLDLNKTVVDGIKKIYGINEKFILFVGSLEPRKNLTFLLQIIPTLYREYGIQLVVVGGKGWKNSEIKDIVLNENFPKDSTLFCGYVSNEDLAKLYNVANCFVSASIGEGFGMPQLEAMLCGCPVVTAHNTAMIEVSQGKTAAYTVDGYDKDVWIETIAKVVSRKEETVESEFKSFDWNSIVKDLHSYIGI